ncbi:hypothetical protein GCM10027059_00080 [Myceligenerans halotolerans]
MAKKSRSRAKKYGNPAKRAAILEAERVAREGRGAPPVLSGLDGPPDHAMGVLQRFMGIPAAGSAGQRTAEWFGPAHEEIRAGATALVDVEGPRALVVAVGRLLGGVLHDVVQSEKFGLFFEEFSAEVIERTLASLRAGGDDVGTHARLMYGIVAMALPDDAEDMWKEYLAALGESQVFPAESWLLARPEIRSTDRMWRALDGCGGARRAIVAEMSWGADTFVYAWDIDVCESPLPVNAGAFDGAEQAVAAWRDWVGEAAAEAVAEPVDDVEWGLLYRDQFTGVRGEETRALMDNWFLTHRMALTVGTRLGTEPQVESGDHTAELDEFLAWYEAERGAPLPAEKKDHADALAEYWCQGTVSDSWSVISPHRISWNVTGMADWFDDEWAPKVIGLLPDWIRFQGQRAGASTEQVERAVAIARGEEQRRPEDCPGTERA